MMTFDPKVVGARCLGEGLDFSAITLSTETREG